MSRFVVSRLAQSLFVVWAVVSAAFLLVHLIPGDPVRLILGAQATPASVRGLRHQLGLDVPLLTAYDHYLAGLLHGNLGTSITYRPSSVASIIGGRIVPSVLLVTYALLLIALVVTPLAVLAALMRNHFADHSIRFLSTVTFVMPSFWIGILLAYLFGLQLHLLPTSGYESGIGAIKSLTLPAITLALSVAPLFLRTLRSSTIENLSADFARAARARGLSKWRVLYRHVVRNSLTSTVTLFGVSMGTLLSFTVVIENVFGIPGLGSLIVESVNTRDYPVVEGLTVVFGVAVVVSNFIADVTYARLDPRVVL